MSKRSLQRRLTAAGTSFDAIVDSVRSDLAYAYLQDSRLSVAQIAETLHFSETRALSRAVRRWYTVSPRALKHGGAALAPPMNPTSAEHARGGKVCARPIRSRCSRY